MNKDGPRIVEINPPNPAHDVVAFLEEYLERAKTGEFHAVAAAFVCKDGRTTTSWTASPLFGLLLGAVAHLGWRMSRQQEEDNDSR